MKLLKRIFPVSIALIMAMPILILLLISAGFDSDGGWIYFFNESVAMPVADVDTVIQTDSIVTANTHASILQFASTLFVTAPSQQALVTILNGVDKDTTRYISKASGNGTKDTLWLAIALEDAIGLGDSVQIKWLTDFVTIDTTIVDRYPNPLMAENAILARVVSLSSYESTGVRVVVQNRTGSNGSWTGIFDADFDSVLVDSGIVVKDTLASGVQIGDQWRTIVILTDSVSHDAARILTADVEVIWRGRKY